MSTQKQHHTKARRDRARKMLELKKKSLVKCSHCGAEIKPHITCPKCGYYKGKEIINTTKKVKKQK